MSRSYFVDDGRGDLLEIGDSPFSGSRGVETVFFGFRVVDMMDVKAVRKCT